MIIEHIHHWFNKITSAMLSSGILSLIALVSIVFFILKVIDWIIERIKQFWKS